ncbi:polypeptide N-acetylgalactosaminyltransferase 5-like [Gigantopelta aegis]|uniref:polypeptide N-acetylgalactosaminyltransferase 5-like n=1 Tax=Gigantopelta aegis TaxID=1735272 RepID=UPI001B88E642|nr:polypeptide N-acetylgalactosaminyltransferase 5-like [Gigantopelta aegis]
MRQRWPRSFCRTVVVLFVLLWMLSFLFIEKLLPGQSWSEKEEQMLARHRIKGSHGVQINSDRRHRIPAPHGVQINSDRRHRKKAFHGVQVNSDRRHSLPTHTKYMRRRRRKRKRKIKKLKKKLYGGRVFQNMVRDVNKNVARFIIGRNKIDDVAFPSFVAENPINAPGENGTGIKVKLSKEMKLKKEAGFKKYQFNVIASDAISVRRRLPDRRSNYCLKEAQTYANLPEASVIMCFRNEAWSVLLRSVHSVLDRSPPSLLREIILVDDFSTEDFLKKPLDKYMKQFPKVKIVRTDKREGLIRARLKGVSMAIAPVLIFLDSHIECLPGWIEPLLARIHSDAHIVPFPVIDYITGYDFHVAYLAYAVGTFNWNLDYTWDSDNSDYSSDDKVDNDAPRKSATMPGGLFAVSKKYFLKIGAYDPGLDFWGGENMELSFKVWMCNGSIELVPCSHVGHVFRPKNPNSWSSAIDPVKRNSMRVAEVWMDEYRQYVYELYNYKLGDFGDVSERKKMRQRLGCHSFDWFMKTVVPHKYVPRDVVGVGEIRSAAYTDALCIDSMGRNTLHLLRCHGTGQTQFWYITRDGIFQQDPESVCVLQNGLLLLSKWKCKAVKSFWTYRQDNSMFHTPTEHCLQATPNMTLVMKPCDRSVWQQWIMARQRPKLKEKY